MERQEYNVPGRGQVMLLPSIRGKWGLSGDNSYVEMADVGDAVVVVPERASWSSLNLYPAVAKVRRRVLDTRISGTWNPALPDSAHYETLPPFGQYKVHEEGKVSVPSVALKRWGMYATAGSVVELNLDDMLLITPPWAAPKNWEDVESIASTRLRTAATPGDEYLAKEDWSEIYEAWCKDLGNRVLRHLWVPETVSALNLGKDTSLLGQALARATIHIALQRADQLNHEY